jgi:hypothetical protein
MNTQLLETILKLAISQPVENSQDPTGQHIAVLDRGFVYVGEISWQGEWMKIENAKNIRVWGTENGLGQLKDGPLSNTKLDICGQVLVPKKALISLTPCKGF